jgi:23S rRNA (cytidine1920-2'-O)/16S rRNA (cytidine1409-2'-O)-methyltransferase
MPKTRLDLLLVERGLAETRSQAQRLIMAGQVRLAGQVVLKPATSVASDAALQIEQAPPFVSRGGQKLQAALQAFALDAADLVCADVGASTGGFTDCLLQHGATRVYAIDVGQGILHWKLRQDPRVVVMERTNARYLTRLPEPVQLVTIDASFISLKLLLPVVRGWFSPSPPAPLPKGEENGQLIALIKPQFEAGRRQAARGDGVIRDPAIHRQVLLDVLTFAQEQAYSLRGLIRSPLTGPKGNLEFLAWLSYPASGPIALAPLIDAVFPLE